MNGGVTSGELESLSPLAREIAQGLNNAIAHVRGEAVEARASTLELPDPAPEYSEKDIRRVRARLRMTQKSFAHVMNISPKTVEAWEAGTKSPGPPARRLLQILSDRKAMNTFANLAADNPSNASTRKKGKTLGKARRVKAG